MGLGIRETSLDRSICLGAMLQPGPTIAPDLTEDPCFVVNPLVTGEPYLRFHAGAVLRTPEGLPLGAPCVGGDNCGSQLVRCFRYEFLIAILPSSNVKTSHP